MIIGPADAVLRQGNSIQTDGFRPFHERDRIDIAAAGITVRVDVEIDVHTRPTTPSAY